jgi:tRNA A37 threonylcarbamoyladenosine synthetase subunit TsaC/SUA5/YrdC
VDIIVDDGSEPGFQVSTILDMTNEEPAIVRKGLGWEAVAPLALPVSPGWE